jgi:hypothetical protein
MRPSLPFAKTSFARTEPPNGNLETAVASRVAQQRCAAVSRLSRQATVRSPAEGGRATIEIRGVDVPRGALAPQRIPRDLLSYVAEPTSFTWRTGAAQNA